MANYDIFDEQYYLSQYGFVKDAVAKGLVKSGLEHFQKYGQAAGLTKVSRYFDENTFLAGNPDLRPFIRSVNPNGVFASALDYYIQYGYEEGGRRIQVFPVSPEYDELFYLISNSELLPLVENGTFKSGYQHFIKYGSKEGRFGTAFFELEYLKQNPELIPFINSGALKTGREHYFQFGQFEPNRSATFVGTRRNDSLTGVGVGDVELIGVEVGIDSRGNRQYESFGINETDILIGGPGSDTFVLGVPATSGNTTPTPLYLVDGQARIRDFDIANDFIQLQGDSLANYTIFPVVGDLYIEIKTPSRFPIVEVIGIIEGGANLSLTLQAVNPNGTFLIG